MMGHVGELQTTLAMYVYLPTEFDGNQNFHNQP